MTADQAALRDAVAAILAGAGIDGSAWVGADGILKVAIARISDVEPLRRVLRTAGYTAGGLRTSWTFDVREIG